jgi:hypothetical protein
MVMKVIHTCCGKNKTVMKVKRIIILNEISMTNILMNIPFHIFSLLKHTFKKKLKWDYGINAYL